VALILVTGASSGLGLATANELADAGHDVVLHARNAHRLGDPSVGQRMRDVVFGDLGDLDQVVSLGRQLHDVGRFDAVIHNAGVIDGPEVFTVNVVAPYLLTALLAPPDRTIVLSSSMHHGGSTDIDAVDFSDASRGRRAYDDSKLYVTALAMALARMRPDLVSHAVDPGWVPTRMGGPSATDDLDQGHRTQTWLATADSSMIKPRTGGYWFHHRTQRPHPATLDATFQDVLLAKLAAHTGVGLRASGTPATESPE
jgi:NAD(P)-dependent dehydrogenase (short-subunit alcohol dehydrogenase family)